MENTIGLKANAAIITLSVLLMILLMLSGCGQATLRPATNPSNTSTALPTPKVSVAQPGRTIVVRRGDTLYNLARTHNITPRDLSAWNGLSDPNTIYPGQTLRLYPSSSGAIVSMPPATTNPSAGTANTASPTASTTPVPTVSNTPTPSSSITWQWPTEGQITGRFAANDPTKEGIDIAGHNGQAVRATANGVVIYSGAPPTLYYGELIIIKHNDHWLSAYGHNRKRLVSEGQSVRAGEQIAEMGRTGTDRDILHFEIRHDGKPVDPLRYLPAR